MYEGSARACFCLPDIIGMGSSRVIAPTRNCDNGAAGTYQTNRSSVHFVNNLWQFRRLYMNASLFADKSRLISESVHWVEIAQKNLAKSQAISLAVNDGFVKVGAVTAGTSPWLPHVVSVPYTTPHTN
jgi:hypothetical protein